MIFLRLFFLFIVQLQCTALPNPKRHTSHHHQRSRNCANRTNVKHSKGRIAVGIAGVSRGINYTWATVERHVFGALRNHNFEIDVFWSSVANPDFFGHQMDDFEMSIANPCLFSIVPQEGLRDLYYEKFCKIREYDCSRPGMLLSKTLTPQQTKMFSTKNSKYVHDLMNYLLCFDAQSRLADMLRLHTKLHGFEYDGVLLIRPDVAFIRDVDLPSKFHLLQNNARDIWIPDFQHFSNGLNDRGAFGSQEVMLKYLDRGSAFFANNSYGVVIAEKFLADFLINEGLVWKKSDMRFLRIRPMEDNGEDMGIIDGFDVKPKQLNVPANDEDLLRCSGPANVWITHKTMNFPYKTIRTDVC